LLFENYGQEVGGPIHCWFPNLKGGGPVSPVLTVVAPMTALCTVMYWDETVEYVLSFSPLFGATVVSLEAQFPPHFNLQNAANHYQSLHDFAPDFLGEGKRRQ